MLTTLRGKLVVVFVALIALTTLLGTVFSLWATDTRLALYATAQGQANAQTLATLLEARYAFQGGWQDFAPTMTTTITSTVTNPGTNPGTTAITTTTPDETAWKPQGDWGKLLQGFLALDDTTVQSIQAGKQSWAQVAAARQVAPPVLVQQIWQAERQIIETDILSGVLPLYAYVQNKEAVTTAAYHFIQSAPPPSAAATWLTDALRNVEGRVLIADSSGSVLYDSQAAWLGRRLTPTELAVGVPIYNRKQSLTSQVGVVLVAVDNSTYNAQQRAFAQGIRRLLIFSGLLAGGVALSVAFWLAQRLAQPLVALTAATRRLANGEALLALPAPGRDELGQLNRAFQQMAQELETQRMLRRQLINDVAHDLKTPLSIINLEIEAADLELQTTEAALKQVKLETRQLDALINDLSWLAKQDRGEFILQPQPTELGRFTAQMVERWQSKAEAAGLQLRFHSDASALVANLDEQRITQVLHNLLANAVAYTPAGGQILVDIVRRPHPTQFGTPCAVTTVRNTGPGISPTDLPHIFERFYRGDKSRSRHSGGSGLGLAIVRSIVELHGGWTWAESVPQQWTTIGYGVPLLDEAHQHQES